MRLEKMPKIELHCHLDGSLRPETVKEILASKSEYLTIEAVEQLLIAPENCDSLDTYLKCFDLPIRLMQTADSLERIAYELVEDAYTEGVRYIEIRFAPQLHTNEGLAYADIIEAVIRGLRRAEGQYEVKGNFILSYMRNTDAEGIYKLIEAGRPYLGNGVVALDLCAGERDLFAPRFEKAMAYARTLGYHMTIHAGETGIVENISDAVNLLGAERIGHGVAMSTHPEVMALVKSHGVCVECCPTSNVQTKAIQAIEEHPILNYHELGLKVSVNTDNRTVSGTTMTGEFSKLAKAFDIPDELYRTIYEVSVEASFCDEATKRWLRGLV